jgi:plastocyanin
MPKVKKQPFSFYTLQKIYLLLISIVFIAVVAILSLHITKRDIQNQTTKVNPQETNDEQHESYEEPAQAPDTNWVEITDAGINPPNARIGINSLVVWYNKTTTSLAIVADDSMYSLPEFGPNEQSSPVTFSTAGTFTYHTTLNPQLKGTITVIK